jgi:uncharacterized protein
MSLIRCPICHEEFDPEQSPAMPFCSERCRRIDLGRWLDERYMLPVERAEEDAELPPDEEL